MTISTGMPWFRLYRDLATSPKLYALEDAVGEAALAYLVKWWCGVAAHRPDGSIAGLSDTVMERWADWRGARGALMAALRAAGWVEGDTVHGWSDRQGGVLAKVERDRVSRAESARDTRGQRADNVRTPHVTQGGTPQTDVRERRGEEKRGEEKRGERDLPDARAREPETLAPRAEATEPPNPEPINRGRVNPDAPAPLPGRLLSVAGRQGGWQAGKPYTVDELMRQPEGAQLRADFPALDGAKGRPSVDDVIGAMWDSFGRWSWPTEALSKLRVYVAQHHSKHREAYLRDGGIIPDKPRARAGPAHRPVERDFEAELAKVEASPEALERMGYKL